MREVVEVEGGDLGRGHKISFQTRVSTGLSGPSLVNINIGQGRNVSATSTAGFRAGT